jgi:Domain of unknown function (DUF4116)
MARAIAADSLGTLYLATGDVLADADVILGAAKQSSDAVNYAAESLKANKDFIRKVSAAVAPSIVLQYAAESVRDDKDVVLECVSLVGDSICYASERLRGDREVFNVARKSIGDSGEYIQYVCVCTTDDVCMCASSRMRLLL